MDSEFLDSVINRVRDLVPEGWTVQDRFTGYKQGAPTTESVTVAVDFTGGYFLEVGVDVDVWAPGPDTAEADDVAHAIEDSLHGWAVNTERQGTVRLWASTREPILDASEDVAHVTMRLNGRGFRR